MEYTINPYQKADAKKIIAIRGNSSFSDAIKRSAAVDETREKDNPESSYIEFTSPKDAIITIGGQSFTVKFSSQEYTDVFSLVEVDDSLDFFGNATKRGVVMGTSKELTSKVKPVNMQSAESKHTIEVMPMSKVLATSSTQGNRTSTSSSSSLLQPAYSNSSTEEDSHSRKKQKFESTPATMMRQSGNSGRNTSLSLPDSRDILPKSLFVKFENLPFDVKMSDIRNVISPLKFACFHLVPQFTSKTFNAFVVFESDNGAALALQRSGEPMHFRSSTKSKVETIAAKIRNVSRLEATWAAHTSLWIDATSPTVTSKTLIWTLFDRTIEQSDFTTTPLCTFVEDEDACKDCRDIYNRCNPYSDLVDDEAFTTLLMETMDAKNLPSNELIIQNALKTLSMTKPQLEKMTELQKYMYHLASMLITVKSLRLLFECETSAELFLLQIAISWTKRMQRLIEGLYVMFWKVHLAIKIESL